MFRIVLFIRCTLWGALLPCASIGTSHASTSSPHLPQLTHHVSDCGDSGPNTLRGKVGVAASGDTINVSACTKILINKTITISQASLSIIGKTSTGTSISSTQSARPFQHAGTGTFTLRYIHVKDGVVTGENAEGGCIRSNGSVTLKDSSVTGCVARRTTGTNPVRGGGIHASDTITLDHSLVQNNIATSTTSGALQGGGTWSGQETIVLNNSLYAGNVLGEAGDSSIGNAGNTGGGAIWSSGDMTLSDSTVRDNHVYTSGGAPTECIGGGIHVQTPSGSIRSAQFSYAVIRDNSTNLREGGGICLDGNKLEATLDTVRITGNSAPGDAGFSAKNLTQLNIVRSTVDNNMALYGGGGLSTWNVANITISDTTVSGNQAGNTISGVDINTAHTLIISNSTISGNHIAAGSGYGAGLFLSQVTDALIKNSTITANTSQDLPPGSPSPGATGIGIYIGDDTHVTLSSTIVSDNHWDTVSSSGIRISHFNDIVVKPSSSSTITGTHNLIGQSTYSLPSNNISSTYPMLGALQDNGGPTLTHLPHPGSPAIDAGASNGLTRDQRGDPYMRVQGAASDIGAVERNETLDLDLFKDGFESSH